MRLCLEDKKQEFMDGIEENEKSLSDSMDNWDEPQDMGKF
jgi:hypothetical protein